MRVRLVRSSERAYDPEYCIYKIKWVQSCKLLIFGWFQYRVVAPVMHPTAEVTPEVWLILHHTELITKGLRVHVYTHGWLWNL